MFRKEQRNWELFLLHCNACILCFIFIPNDMIDDKSLIFPYFMLIHGATICTVLCFARVYVKLFEKSIYFLLQIESNNRKRSHNQQYFSICNASNSGREYRNLYRDQHIQRGFVSNGEIKKANTSGYIRWNRIESVLNPYQKKYFPFKKKSYSKYTMLNNRQQDILQIYNKYMFFSSICFTCVFFFAQQSTFVPIVDHFLRFPSTRWYTRRKEQHCALQRYNRR